MAQVKGVADRHGRLFLGKKFHLGKGTVSIDPVQGEVTVRDKPRPALSAQDSWKVVLKKDGPLPIREHRFVNVSRPDRQALAATSEADPESVGKSLVGFDPRHVTDGKNEPFRRDHHPLCAVLGFLSGRLHNHEWLRVSLHMLLDHLQQFIRTRRGNTESNSSEKQGEARSGQRENHPSLCKPFQSGSTRGSRHPSMHFPVMFPSISHRSIFS